MVQRNHIDGTKEQWYSTEAILLYRRLNNEIQ